MLRKPKENYWKMAVEGFLSILAMMGITFIAAGRMDYWQLWIYGATLLFITLYIFAAFVNKPDVVRERLRPGPGMKWWDKIFFAIFVPSYLVILIVAGLDAGRFSWTARLPVYVYAIGYAGLIISYLIIFWSMWANKFFSSVVRIQTERGHLVVESGPYRYVRHPGYIGAILLVICSPLVLGSLWAMMPAGVMVVLLLVRTHLEDKTLRKELAGYEKYAEKVRYRLLPGIW